MAKDKPPPTFWDCNNKAIFVQIVKEHKILGNFANNNPKKIVGTACEIAFAGSEKRSGGAPETVYAIKNQWQCVHSILFECMRSFLYLLQLKKEYKIVKNLQEKSGLRWDSVNHLPETNIEVWDAYVKVSVHSTQLLHIELQYLLLQGHPKAKPYRLKPFPLYDDIAKIVGSTCATGKKAYRGGQSQRDRDTTTGTPLSMIDPTLLPPLSSNDKNSMPNSLVQWHHHGILLYRFTHYFSLV